MIAEANRLQGLANDCDTILQLSRSMTGNLNTHWEGESANQFLSANEEWRNEMTQIRNEFLAISRIIRKVTEEIRQADKRAANAVKRV